MADLLITQIRCRLAFVDAQVTAGTPRAPLQHAAANARQLIFKQHRAMQIEDVTTLTHEINAGPWTTEERLLLAQSLTHGVMGANDPALGLRGNGMSQECKYHEAFYKATEWASFLSEQLSEAAKRTTMARA